jgi:hypothetical protein
MDDRVWYYNYFKKFVDTPSLRVRNNLPPVSAEIPLPREKEGDTSAGSRAPETVRETAAGVSDSSSVKVATPVKEREKVLFGKAPPALLAAIKRPAKAEDPASLDSSSAVRSRKRGIDKVDVGGRREPAKKAKGKPRLTDVFPGLAKFK